MLRAGRSLSVLMTCAILASGCASSGTVVQQSQRNVITNEELVRAGDVNIYDALVQLRPSFLRSRGGSGVTTQQAVQVYVGGMLMPGLDHLKEIMVKGVKEITFLEPQQANTRFGGNNTGGALVVVLM